MIYKVQATNKRGRSHFFVRQVRVLEKIQKKMIRANIRNSEDVFIGLIDEDNNEFRIVWNSNIDNYPEYNRLGSNEHFQSFE